MGVLVCVVVVLVSVLSGILFTVIRLHTPLSLIWLTWPRWAFLPLFHCLASQVALDIAWLDHTRLLGAVQCCCVCIVVPYWWLLGSVRCCWGCIVVPYQVAWSRAFLLGATFIHWMDVPGIVLRHIPNTGRFVPALSYFVMPSVVWSVFWVITHSALLLVTVVCSCCCFLVVHGGCCKIIVGVTFSSKERVGTLRLEQLYPPRLVLCSGCE